MDFDEIHLLTTSTTNGSNPSSPNSGNGSGEDYSTHFIEEPISNWIKAIKDAIDKGDWYGAGEMLANKLNELVDSWDAHAWGNKLGEKIHNGLRFFLGFMENTKWYNIGDKLGDAFNGIFEKLPSSEIGKALAAPIKAGVDVALGFLKKADFQPLGDAVASFINEIFDPDFVKKVGDTIGEAINKGIQFFKGLIMGREYVDPTTGEVFIEGGIKWDNVGEGLMTALFTAIKTIKWEDLGEAAGNLFTGIIDAIGTGITYAATHINELWDAITKFAKAFFGAIWEWFWPSLQEFMFGDNYTAESANDRPNAPVTTGSGAKSTEEFSQEWNNAINGAATALGALKQSATIPITVTDVNNGLRSATQWSYNTKNNLGAVGGKLFGVTVTDNKSGLKNTSSYTTTVTTGLKFFNGKKFSFSMTTSGLSTATSNLKSMEAYLNGIAKMNGKKVKMTVEVLGSGKNAKVVVNNYMGTGLQAYAGGGWPQAGDLFIANEAGPELVGSMNGRTAVANTNEITGIREAVYDAGDTEAALLKEQNGLLRALLAKETGVTFAPSVAAGKWISQSQALYARASG